MALREFKLPDDIALLVEIIPPSFKYPENPEWNVQDDEAEAMVDSMEGARKIWPVIRVMQFLWPPARDIMRGYVWEEDGKPVGVTNVLREGNTDRWLIGNVSVLPEYRRRGIARKLVEASVEYAKGRGAKSITLGVVAGNTPAYSLYESLGFECFSGGMELSYEADGPPEAVPLPDGYTVEESSPNAWQPRYELAQRVTPDAVKAYDPVEEGRYRTPAFMRLLIPIIERAMGGATQFWLARDSSGVVVGLARNRTRTREGGVNMIQVMVDPAHGDLAAYLLRFVMRETWNASPDRRIELSVKQWQAAEFRAALDAGFVKQYDSDFLGMVIGGE